MLATFRVHKDRNYVTIHKGFLENAVLSWRAKGILAYLLSKPDDWVVQIKDVIEHAKESNAAVRSAIKELLLQGYLAKSTRREAGKFVRFEYDVYESPRLNPGSSYNYLVSAPFITNGEMDDFRHGKAQSKAIRKEVERANLTYTEDMKTH